MKRIFAIILLVLMMVGLIASPILASVLTNAQYIGTVTVTNVSTATTKVSVPFTLSTDNLINNGYILTNCTNTAIQINGADVAYMPAVSGTTDWMVYVPTVPAGDSSASLYTGGGDMVSKIRYFPADAGMTTTNSASLEPGNNFSIEQKGYVDTTAGAGKNLVNKTSALLVNVDTVTNGKLNAKINPGAGTVTAYNYLYPTSDILTGITTANPGGTHYSTVDEVYTTPDDGDYVSTSNVNYEKDRYGLTDTTLASNDIITEVRVYFRVFSGGGGGNSYYTPHFYLTVTEQAGTQQSNFGGGGVGTTYSQIITRPGGGAWSKADLDALYSGISIKGSADSGGTTAFCTQLYIKVSYTDVSACEVIASVTGVTSAEHTITTSADATWLMLSIDGNTSWDGTHSTRTALNLATVSASGTNWITFENGVMPYVEYQKITVSGTLQQSVKWENDTTFQDSSPGGLNDATPIFRDTTTDGDVSASLTTFAPINLSEASGTFISGGGTSFISGVPAAIPHMYDEGETGGLFGLGGLVNPFLATADIPQAVFWYPLAFAVAISLGFLAYYWTRQLLVQAVVSGVIMAFFSVGGVLGEGLLPFWTVLVFVLEVIMLLVIGEKQTV